MAKRRILHLIVVTVALVLCGGTGQAQQPLTKVRVTIVPIMSIAALYAGIEQGYFKDEGLDVSTEANQAGGAIGIPGMMAGVYDIAYTNTPSAILAMAQGIDLRIIAGSSKNPGTPPDQVALIGRVEDKLRSGKDLEGKTIAVNAKNNVQWLFSRAWVKQTGGDPDKVNFREVPFPNMIDALKTKQVDSALAIDPFLTFSRRDPSLDVVGWAFNVVAPNIQGAIYVVTGETATKRPDLVAKFQRAHDKGGEWVNKNVGTEPYLKLVSSYTKMDPALISSMPKSFADTDIDVASLKRMEELMLEHGLLTKPVDSPAKIFIAH